MSVQPILMTFDANALWDLWRPTFGLVRALAPDISQDDAEDITGDAFLRVLRVGPQMDDRPDALRRYLFMVARNLIIDRTRHERLVRFVGLDTAEYQRGTVDAGGSRHVARIDLRDAMACLPAHYQTALQSRAEGHSVETIATAMGTTNQAVRALNHRGYRQLRPLLEATS